MPRLEKPCALSPGDTIAIVAPAGPLDDAPHARHLEGCEVLLRGEGFRTVRRADIEARAGYLAGDDDRRAAELMQFIEDSSVAAIHCARGGYGVARILHRLDPERVRAAAKPLLGFSDITSLLLWQRRCAGLVGFHAPMLASATEAQLSETLQLLMGREPLPYALIGTPGGGGRARGRLIGGNLSLLSASIGTPWEIVTRGAILLIEEVGEQPYRIDRMLQQLRAAGKLDVLAGVALGEFLNCGDDRYPDPSAGQVLREVFGEFDIPLVSDLPVGHGLENRPWPFGVRAEIDGDAGVLQVLEHGVRRR